MNGFIDIHAHLNMLETTPDETLRLAEAAGVAQIFTIGTGPADWPTVLSLAKTYYPRVVGTLGVHPHDAKDFDATAAQAIRQNAPEPEIVAVGEIGLDYYYDNSPRETQRAAFEQQLQLALDLNLPVQIHTRDAEDDTVSILSQFGGRVQGLLHCFTSSRKLAEQALDLGLDISFSGVVTFKNADPLRQVADMVPLSRLHVETDAPFLAPVPQRGKKNTPAFVTHTADCVAQIKGISKQELQEATVANARRLFKKLPTP